MIDYFESWISGALDHEFKERDAAIRDLNKRAENIEKRHNKKFSQKKQDLRRWF